MNSSSSSPVFARVSILLLASSSLVACAAQVTGDFFGDAGGTCADDPSLCVDATHHDGAAHHDGASQIDAGPGDSSTFDSSTFDSSTFDSSTFDSSTFDSGVDAARIDSSTPDTGTIGTLIFDSIPAQSGSSSRTGGDACGTQVTVVTTTTISRISVKNTLSGTGNIKFLIFSGGTLVYSSAPKLFAVAGDSWKDSDPMSFTLVAGQSYGITGISDASSSTWDYDTVAETTGPIHSTVSNPNVTNFATPTLGSPGGADCGVRLYN